MSMQVSTDYRLVSFHLRTSLVALKALFLTAVRFQFSTPAQIKKVQRRKTEKLLAFAANRVPYFREQVKKGSGPYRLEDFPVTSKELMMSQFEKFISDPKVSLAGVNEHIEMRKMQTELYLGKYVICTTSGTTGRAGIFLIDQGSWGLLRAIAMSRMFLGHFFPFLLSRLLTGRRSRFAFFIAYGNNNITYLLSKYLPAIFGLFIKSKLFSVHDPATQVVKELLEFKPDLLHAYPTSLAAMAAELLETGTRIDVRVITTGSEPFATEAQKLVEAVFPGVPIHQAYGATEFSCMAHQCLEGGLHLNEDYCILELVDRDYRPVKQGQQAEKVLLTNLSNRVQPLIRYEMSDRIEIDSTPCPCGRPYAVMRIHGRTDETLHLQDRKGVYRPIPPIPIQDLFFSQTGIRKFKVVHERQNFLRIYFNTVGDVSFEEKKAALEVSFKNYFIKNDLGDTVTFSFEILKEDPKDAGKSRAISSLVPAPTRS